MSKPHSILATRRCPMISGAPPILTATLVATLVAAWALLFACPSAVRANVILDFGRSPSSDARIAADIVAAGPTIEPQADNALFENFGAPLGYPPAAPRDKTTTAPPVLAGAGTSVNAQAAVGLVAGDTLSAIAAPSAAPFALLATAGDTADVAPSSRSTDVQLSNVSRHADPSVSFPATPDTVAAVDPVLDLQQSPAQLPAEPIPLPTSAMGFMFLAGTFLTVKLSQRPAHF